MSRNTLTRDQVFIDTGLAAKWTAEGEAIGEAIGEARVARNLLKNGFSEEQTAQLSGLDISQIKAIAQNNGE